MQENLVFVFVAAICFYCLALGEIPVVFVQEPQNRTIFNLEEPFFFNCSTHIASDNGMDWVVQIQGIYERICSSKNFHDAGSSSISSCQLNYSMEVPNNRTLNLIVDPRIALLGDKYCCQSDNGGGNESCSYLTISQVSSPGPTTAESTTGNSNLYALIVIPVAILVHFS